MIKSKAVRNPYFELLRGLAIMMVVGIHTYKLGDDFSLFVRQILNCAVPLFLACSGFFMAKKDVSDRGKHIAFLKKQIPKVYMPCLIWSVPYLVISLCNGGSVLKGVVNLLLCGFSVYYFIILIIQYYVLLPYYQRINKRYMILNIAVSLISVGVLTFLFNFKAMNIQLVLYAGWFTLWTMFFAVGVLLGKNSKRDYKLLPYWIITILGLILSFVESKYLIGISGGGIGIKVSSFIYSFGIIMLLFSEKAERFFQIRNIVDRFIHLVGKISFGIYLIHCLIILIFIKNMPEIWLAIPWILRMIIILLCSIIVIKIVKPISKKLSSWIGF
ncbi:MAG: acyltransferase [Bacteroidales bacterium]|nr:acyltransferase [Bacteroidales bacterium]